MPFAFLAPVFLAGLAALAIPVLIHLANRPRKNVQRFPSLMFLDAVEYRESSKRRLRNLVLFALRSLALILLIAAFARPFVDRADAVPTAPDGGRELVILIDRSESMMIGDRMARARAAVGEAVSNLRRGDRATLIAFDRSAAALHRATDQAAVVERAAARVEPGAAGTRYGPALRLAESLLAGSPLPRRELVMIGDFQATGWTPEDAPRMPPGTEIRAVPVGDAAAGANVFVAEVDLSRDRFSGRDRVAVLAAVGGRAGEGSAEASVPVELLVDGRVVQSGTAALDGGMATIAFDPLTLPDRPVRATVRAGTDAYPADNAFHFVLTSRRGARVVRGTPRSGDAPFVERALGVGPELDVAAVRADRLDGGVLAGADVVVLEGEPDAESMDGVEAWVRAGGGLVVVLGPGTRAGSWAGRGLLPGEVGGTRDASTGGAALTDLAVAHPALEPLRATPASLAAARVYRFRELAPADDAVVLARFDGTHPAVAAREVGRGRVVAVASPLDGAWNDLAVQPGFVPFLHGLVRFAAGEEPEPAWRRVGELLEAGALLTASPDASGDPGAMPVLLTPADRPVPVRPDSFYTLAERGFYELRDPRSDGPPVLVAVNGDPAESALAAVDPGEVRRAVDGGAAAGLSASFAREDRERRQSLWWYALAAAFVLMAAETVLSNGLSRKALPGAEGE